MTSLRRITSKLGISFFALLFAFVLAEVGARVWLFRFADAQQFGDYATYPQYLERYVTETPRHSRHWYVGYQATPNYSKEFRNGTIRHNSHGFRGDEIEMPKPPGRFRIACLGGSTTYTTEVRDTDLAYPKLLADELRTRIGADVDTINAGLAGWASWETLINFELRVLDLDPDMIVVYHGINDFHARFVWPPEAYRSDNSGTHLPPAKGVFTQDFIEYSTLARILEIRYMGARSHKDRILELRELVPTNFANLYRDQWKAGTYPQGIFEDVTPEQMVAANPPTYFRRNIENLVAIAQSRGIEVVLVTFAYSPHFPKYPWSSSEVHARGYVEMNDVTRAIATERGAHLYDFAAGFPQDKQYFTDGVHVSEAGVKLKAKMFAGYLIENELVPKGQ